MMAVLSSVHKSLISLSHSALVLLFSLVVVACEQKIEPDVVRPVRSMVIESHLSGDQISLTGQLHARDETKLAFRLSGKLIQSSVSVGDTVKVGQILARLDAATERNARNAAEADHAAALALLDQTTAAEHRFGNLLNEQAVSQAEFEEALRQRKAAQAQVPGQAQFCRCAAWVYRA
jgi:membrane fusion protein, multidrug efflux system